MISTLYHHFSHFSYALSFAFDAIANRRAAELAVKPVTTPNSLIVSDLPVSRPSSRSGTALNTSAPALTTTGKQDLVVEQLVSRLEEGFLCMKLFRI